MFVNFHPDDDFMVSTHLDGNPGSAPRLGGDGLLAGHAAVRGLHEEVARLALAERLAPLGVTET